MTVILPTSQSKRQGTPTRRRQTKSTVTRQTILRRFGVRVIMLRHGWKIVTRKWKHFLNTLCTRSKSGHTIVSLASVQFVHNRISKIISQYARKTAFKKRVCLDNIKRKIFEGYAWDIFETTVQSQLDENEMQSSSAKSITPSIKLVSWKFSWSIFLVPFRKG